MNPESVHYRFIDTPNTIRFILFSDFRKILHVIGKKNLFDADHKHIDFQMKRVFFLLLFIMF